MTCSECNKLAEMQCDLNREALANAGLRGAIKTWAKLHERF